MTEVWVDLGCDVVCDVAWWYGHRVLICVGLGFGLVGGNVVVGLGRGGLWGYRLWWHGGFGCGLGVLVVEVQWWHGAMVMVGL